jgi:hypothetical protein
MEYAFLLLFSYISITSILTFIIRRIRKFVWVYTGIPS